MKKLTVILLEGIFCLSLQTSWAAHDSLEKFFQSLGTEANVSEPGAFRDQAAGYYTAGGMMMRQKNKSYQPITISPPRFNAGCSGIDAYFGGISFMSGRGLSELLRQMGTQAATYALQLGLKTMAPQIENLLSQLRKLALDANSMMLGDCRQVQQIFAAALPKGSAFQEHACIDVMKSGGGEDWFGAKEKCRNPREVSEGAKRAQLQSPDMLVGEFNLTWHILKKLKQQGALPESEMEFWLTLLGTIIQYQSGDTLHHRFYAGKAADKSLWKTLLKGKGSYEGLKCIDTENCLNIENTIVPLQEGLIDKIKKRLRNLQAKYLQNSPLSLDDITFLNDVIQVPLWRYIQVLSATGSSAQFDPILDYVALQLMLSQLEKIISQIESYLHDLQTIQYEGEKIKEYRRELHLLKTQILLKQGPLTQQAIFQLNQIIEAEEKRVRLMNSLSS